MISPLEQILFQQLKISKSLSVQEFIELALYHPLYGYYMRQPVFGKAGDYTTAPEISQLFGEMIAIRFLAFLQSGSLKGTSGALIELGPGRGTLMADLLRVFKQYLTLERHLTVYLLEISPKLRQEQQKKLADYPVIWVEKLEEIPLTDWSLIVANEFFDALPIEQYLKVGQGLEQRRIGVVNRQLVFLDPNPLNSESIGIYQNCPSYKIYIDFINERLKQAAGLAILSDYGDKVPQGQPQGDTLQALYRHQYASVFERIGFQDLTHAVDFSQLESLVDSSLQTSLTNQAEFLLSLGLEQRLSNLWANVTSPQQGFELQAGVLRLISPQEMGQMFKVFTIESQLNLRGR